MRRSETEIVTRYADVIGDGNDPELIRLVCDLDTGLTAVEPPESLRGNVPKPAAANGYGALRNNEIPAPHAWLTWRQLAPLPAMLMLLVFLAAGVTLAVTNIANLGRPSNALPPDLLLGSFRHTGPNLRQHGKPELLFVGTQIDSGSAVERWAVVKAIGQFGSVTNLRPTKVPVCDSISPANPARCGAWGNEPGLATFDWTHVRFNSRYITFVHKDLISRDLRMQQRLSPIETRLFNRYVRLPGYRSWHDAVWVTAFGNPRLNAPGREFPLVSIDGYLETGANLAVPSDLQSRYGGSSLTFAAVQRALQRGRSDGRTPPTLVSDVNAEANIITALICHADHMQPKHVCRRAVIRKIVKHVK